MRRRLTTKGGLRILDVGCGDGLFLGRLEEFGEADGVEPDKELVSPSGPYFGRIRMQPFDSSFLPAHEYDVLLMLDVLEHLDDAGGALRHAHTVLRPGGVLLLTVPAFQALWTNHDTINHHRVRYRRKTLRPLVTEARFRILEERYWYQWTCPTKLGIRFTEKLLQRKPEVPRVPPGWLNEALFLVSRAEQKTVGAMGAPFGSTLMMFCERTG